MRKKNKKILMYSLVFLAILTIVGFFYFSTSQSILNVSHLGYDIKQTSSSNSHYSYSLSVKNLNPPPSTAGSCSTQSLKIDDSFTWTTGNDNYAETGSGIVVNLPSDIDFGKTFTTNSITVTGIQAVYYPCSDLTRGITATPTNLIAECTPESQDKITCRIKGDVSVEKQYEGRVKLFLSQDNEVKINVDLYKENIPSTDDTQSSQTTCPSLNSLSCGTGYEEQISTDANGCQINSCVLTSTTTQTDTSSSSSTETTQNTTQIPNSHKTLILTSVAILLFLIIILLFIKRKKRHPRR